MRFAEDILLLALDDDSGQLQPMPPQVFSCVMAGALLFDLAFANRLDNDVHRVFLVDQPGAVPAHLEPLHDTLAALPQPIPLADALAIAALGVPDSLQAIYDHLVEQNVLHRSRCFSSAQANRYAKADWSRVTELRRRIRACVMTDDPPHPDEVVIVSLMHGCGLEHFLFQTDELEQRRARITQLIRMEILGQQILQAVQEARDTSFEKTAASLLGKDDTPGAAAGGVSAVMSAMGHVYKALGMRRGMLPTDQPLLPTDQPQPLKHKIR